MQINSLKAKPIETEGRYLILLFGPDAVLKAAAAHLRQRHRDYTVNIRSTDNPADAYAEGTPCEMRVIIDGGFSKHFISMYEQAGLPVRVMRWDGQALSDVEEGDGSSAAAQPEGQPAMHRLESGEWVQRALALERAADHLNMTVAALTALDEKTINATIEMAYTQPKMKLDVSHQAPVADDKFARTVKRKRK